LASVSILLLLSLAPQTVLAALPPFSRYEIIEKRNFFRPRAENEAGTAEKPEIEPVRPAASSVPALTGVVRVKGAWKAIMENAAGKSFYVGVGEKADGYAVKKIEKDAVVLEKDGEETEVNLKKPDEGQDAKSPKTEPRKKITDDNKTPPDDPRKLTGGEIMRRIRTGGNKKDEDR
jgi:type II secretory pathway component PulC